MAVCTNIWSRDGKSETSYVGKVLNWYERNGYDDSDWYADVWDEEKQEIKTVLYMTTRCGGWGTAELDATDDVLRQVYRKYKRMATSGYSAFNERRAKRIFNGDTVRIVKGRKVPKGTVATVFWSGTVNNPYSRCQEERIGIEVNGDRIFIAAENAELIGWEERLVHGRERKEEIREAAMKMMPRPYRNYFEKIRKPA